MQDNIDPIEEDIGRLTPTLDAIRRDRLVFQMAVTSAKGKLFLHSIRTAMISSFVSIVGSSLFFLSLVNPPPGILTTSNTPSSRVAPNQESLKLKTERVEVDRDSRQLITASSARVVLDKERLEDGLHALDRPGLFSLHASPSRVLTSRSRLEDLEAIQNN